jgi:hypothetical protein
MTPSVERTSAYDPKFYGTTIPNLRASLVPISILASPKFLWRKFPAIFFHKLLYGLLKYDYGEPIVHRDPFFHKEIDRAWIVDLDELVERWADITKHDISTERHRRSKAMLYYEALRKMDLLFLERQEDGRYMVRFPELTEWLVQKQWELLANKTLDGDDLAKLNRLHWFGNGCSWDLIMPNRKRLKVYVGGSIRRKKSVAVCSRTWANYANRIATCNCRAILGGACDYHVWSERPKKRRAIRKQRETLDLGKFFPAHVKQRKEAMKERLRVEIEESAPTFRTWPIANSTGARFFGHSVATEKRRMHWRDTINIVPQAIVMGGNVTFKEIPKLKAIRKRHGAQPLRFHPVPGNHGLFQPQLDCPNLIEFKKKFHNWALYPDIPAELVCRPESDGSVPKECLEITIPQVTEHASPHGKTSWGRTEFKVLSASTVKLAYLGDEGSPQMQEEMEAAGLKPWEGPWRKKKRVPVRGCHHKDRTKVRKQMQADGTWTGMLPMELLTETQADLDRKVSPQTLYRREIREQKKARDEEESRYNSIFSDRIDNGPHRGYKLSRDIRSRSSSSP